MTYSKTFTFVLLQNKLRASDGNAKNTNLLLCSEYEDTSVTLNTEELSKSRDWNIKVGVVY